MAEIIIISSFNTLWLLLSFVGWYLHHVIVVKNNPLEFDVSILLAVIGMPVIWIMICIGLFERLDFSDFENKIRARLDRFFGI